jgi:hypothetical protein
MEAHDGCGGSPCTVEAHRGALKALHGAMEAHHGTLEAHHGSLEAHRGAVKAHHGAVEAHHSVMEAHHAPVLEEDQMVWRNLYYIAFKVLYSSTAGACLIVEKKIWRDILKVVPVEWYHFRPLLILAVLSL